MGSSSQRKEKTLATEAFSPNINEYYMERFHRLINQLRETTTINRTELIGNEIALASAEEQKDELELLKYLATLRVLIDLAQQGWIFEYGADTLSLKMENENVDDKKRIRYRLSAERNAQFKSESVSRFIKKMETTKHYNGNAVSIRSLIGDTKLLIDAIQSNSRICEPYIQLVTDARDELTGYKLSDIWRYFRYTWSIPYKTMPGRNLYYLVRDRLQPYHPVMGIFALGNSVLNLTARDDDIGWTVEAIKKNMSRLSETTYSEQTVSDTAGGRVKVKSTKYIETEEEYQQRANAYADEMYPLLCHSIDNAISDIYVADLNYARQTRYPKQDTVDALLKLAEEYAKLSINNKNNETSPDWKQEAQSNLFKRKRASELAKLLSTKIVFNNAVGASSFERLNSLLSNEAGRRAIHTALIANRKCKIGSNMMDIIVCGSIPPYNELLGGKLISILACSPRVIKDYTDKYQNQVSEIASRMKGKRVIRDSHLVYLGTTSLYAVGSSQYNRIKVPVDESFTLSFREMGITEGYGTVFFSKETTSLFAQILEKLDGGKRIGHVFGEGTSPRFRMISRGLAAIGVKAEAFLKHHSPRIVYSIDLARNTREFLLGLEDTVDYGFDLDNEIEVEEMTQGLIDFWYTRWLTMRLGTVNIVERLNSFNSEEFLLGNI